MSAPVSAAALEFQSDLDRLVAEPAPRMLRRWPLVGAALIVALVTAAALLRVDVVVTANGRLAADAPPVLLKPLNRAVLRALLVRPGDVVKAGQVVAQLDPTLPEADRAVLLLERRALAAEIARLEAELAGRPVLVDSPDAALQAHVQTERAALALARRTELTTAIAALEESARIEAALTPHLAERLAIAAELEAMKATLAAQKSGSRLAALEARGSRLEVEAALSQHDARQSDLTQRLAGAQAALAAFDSDRRRAVAEGLADLGPKLAQIDAALAKAGRIAALSDLIAPRDGVVLAVAAGGPGSVIGESEPVVVLVPSDVALIAEIGIRSAEVGQIAEGDPVAIKIDAFPWRRFGLVAGRLQDVSRASFTPEGGQDAQHPARVTLTGGLGDALLLPGMTLSAEIKTGTRSVLDYFLDPLLRGLNESLREP